MKNKGTKVRHKHNDEHDQLAFNITISRILQYVNDNANKETSFFIVMRTAKNCNDTAYIKR